VRICHLAGALCLISMGPGTPVAADWNEWRGPQRNGVVEQGPPLLDAWSDEGPKRVWMSEEPVRSGDTVRGGGLGSLVVADGRAYCPVILARTEKLTTRTLSEAKLVKLGWTAKKPPAELLASSEKARLSAERQALKNPAEVQAWLRKWTEANLTATQRKQFGGFIVSRLRQGAAAKDLALLEKLAAIKGRPFPSPEALDAWFAENGIEGDLRKALQAQFPTTVTFRDSGVFCLDAATGKTLWKKVLPGGPLLPLYGNHPASSTPCVANGKCYVIGTDGAVFCLDAKTGKTVWTGMAGDGRVQKHCSFVVADGVAVIPAGPLTGFDAETGKVLWTHDKIKATWASPVRWASGGKTCVLVRAGGKIVCLAPKGGSMRSMPAPPRPSRAIAWPSGARAASGSTGSQPRRPSFCGT